eukprot:TRINITY_DN7241_c0_g1_i1.p2 TRINITY_DN7241_c0_g1~~TRINITY_DN7241_c0_g1_i1.p2  ORF type:complete len:530 (-),score=96.61 TRINITY_DN7241_c0_g1_i1:4152-5741(-)
MASHFNAQARTNGQSVPSTVPPPPGLQQQQPQQFNSRYPNMQSAMGWPPDCRFKRPRAASLGHAAGQPPAEPNSANDLLGKISHQLDLQNQLIQHQLARGDTSRNLFVNPMTLLKKCEPSLKKMLTEWHRDTKELLRNYVTHSHLKSNCEYQSRDGTFLRSFDAEAKKKWQFLQSYVLTAKPLARTSADNAFLAEVAKAESEGREPPQYKVDEIYAAMRRRHAKECQEFVVAHQAATLEMLTERSSAQHLAQDMSEKFELWKSTHRRHLRDETIAAAKDLCSQFAECTFRYELPRATSRIESEKAVRDKRNKAQQDANAKFEAMSTKELMALAALEFGQSRPLLPQEEQETVAARQPTTKRISKTAPVPIKSGGVLEYLLNDATETRKDFNIVLKPNKQHQRSTRSSSRSLPSSRLSRRSSRSSSRSVVSLNPSVSSVKSWAPLHRPRSPSVRSVTFAPGKPRSRSSSRGKGKGKGKGKRTGKNAGSSNRNRSNRHTNSHRQQQHAQQHSQQRRHQQNSQSRRDRGRSR